jgi:hypothetical protein
MACHDNNTAGPDVYDAYFEGDWQLTGIIDKWVDSLENVPRPPSATELRTWHVQGSVAYHGDTLRAPVNVEWGYRHGAGDWFLVNGSVRISTTLLGADGQWELYEADFVASRGTGSLQLTDNHGYHEFYQLAAP